MGESRTSAHPQESLLGGSALPPQLFFSAAPLGLSQICPGLAHPLKRPGARATQALISLGVDTLPGTQGASERRDAEREVKPHGELG